MKKNKTIKGGEKKMFVKDLLSGEEAAEYLGCSKDHLYDLKRSGKLPYVQYGGKTSKVLFDVRDLDRFINKSKKVDKPVNTTNSL